MNWKAAIATVALTMAGASTLTLAQDGGNPGGDRGGDRQPGGDRGQRGNFDPAEWQKRMMERFKEQLKAPDDEWAVIQPKLEKVMTAQREARAGGMFGGRGGRGGPGGPGGDQQQDTSALGVASRELRTALENENTSGEELDKKLAAFREARAKAQANLEAARKDLKEILSPRQEASLVMIGILE